MDTPTQEGSSDRTVRRLTRLIYSPLYLQELRFVLRVKNLFGQSQQRSLSPSLCRYLDL